jgi:hypothetical protein
MQKKYYRVGQATDAITLHASCMLDTEGYNHTISGYVILLAFPLQQWLHERASILLYKYIVCLVVFSHTETEHVGSNGNTFNLHLADGSFAVWLNQ